MQRCQYWNKVFNTNITDIDYFDDYIIELSKQQNYEYDDSVCLFLKTDNGYEIFDYNGNPYQIKPCGTREYLRILNRYETIVTNFYFEYPKVNGYEKNIFRKEIIENYETAYQTHFFSDKLIYDYKDNNVFFNSSYHNSYKNNDYWKFCSELLGKLEYGKVFDDLIIKPEINVSTFGRWYYSKFKIQNNIVERQKVIDKLKKHDIILLTADLVSAEPTTISNLSNSDTIRMLINKRIETNDIDLRRMIKDLLNVYIHSALTPENSFKWFKETNPNYNRLEQYLNKKIIDVYYAIDNETKEYNRKIINDYRTKLSTNELFRRMIIPNVMEKNDREIIKHHRKILQGHTQDIVLKILYNLYLDNKVTLNDILWTIYDSFTLIIEDESIVDDIHKISNSLGYRIETHIEI